MRFVFIAIQLFYFATSIGQVNKRDTTNGTTLNNFDTCKIFDNDALLNLVTKTRHRQPLIVANDIIVGVDNLIDSILLITSITVLKCPEAFKKFGYIGYNGVINVSTKQKFETETPNKIRRKKVNGLKGKIIFAMNGDVIKDTSIRISSASIKEVELIKSGVTKGQNPRFKKYNCINIWTLAELERTPISYGR